MLDFDLESNVSSYFLSFFIIKIHSQTSIHHVVPRLQILRKWARGLWPAVNSMMESWLWKYEYVYIVEIHCGCEVLMLPRQLSAADSSGRQPGCARGFGSWTGGWAQQNCSSGRRLQRASNGLCQMILWLFWSARECITTLGKRGGSVYVGTSIRSRA